MPKICAAHKFKPRQQPAHSTQSAQSAAERAGAENGAAARAHGAAQRQPAAGHPPPPTSGVSRYIERLILPINKSTLHQVVVESIQAIIKVFYNPQLYPDAVDATAEANAFIATIDNVSHMTLLAVFFLLLNVDSTLKSRIANLEVNKRKLTRFFFDLNKYAVSKFLDSETMSVADFVFLAEELYILA